MKDQELHKAAEKATDIDGLDWENVYAREKFIEGAKWQQEQFKKESTAHYIDRHIVQAMVEVAKQKMYSEEDMKKAFKVGFSVGYGSDTYATEEKDKTCEEWFEQFKK